MRLALLLSSATLAACWSSSPPATPLASNAPPPITPAPSILWVDNQLVERRLPAIAADGSVVVLGIEKPDGARGNPNYRLELRGRDDRVQWSHDVLTVDEVDSGAFFDETGPLAPLRDRIARANAELERLHATHRLEPLQELTLDNRENAPLVEQTAQGANLAIAWKADHVVITDERGDGKALLLDLPAPRSWLAAPSRSNTHACTNPAYIDESWAAPGHRLAVITVNYEGTDACWEPDSQLHVVVW